MRLYLRVIKRSFSIIILTCILFSCERPAVKIWHEGQPLRWSDFRGTIPPGNPYLAVTYCRTVSTLKVPKKNPAARPVFHVRAVFLRDSSYTVITSEGYQILQHEQLHFDIAELHARILYKEVMKIPFSTDFHLKVREAVATNRLAFMYMQWRYDWGTMHSADPEKQRNWKEYISRKLSGLSAVH